MARKKEETTVDTSVETETKTPTVSLFGSNTSAQPDSEVDTAAIDEAVAEDTASEEPAPEASEDAVEAIVNGSNELDGLSVEELRRQQAEIEKRLNEKTSAEKKGILDQVILVIAEYGITTEEVVTALGGYKQKRKGSPAKVKFRDPATGAEWTGRGKEPLWIKGKDRAQFAVADEVAQAA